MQAAMVDSPRVLIGQSSKIQSLVHQIDKVSPTRWPVLILGETGTGKDLIAKTLHRQASSQGQFVVIDCSALVGPLMESELFGHTKGAFTGASNTKMGLIEMANGGTAFFDEIGELPIDMQSKLLRVLQEKEFRPVGSNHVRRSDFRVVAATNRDLAAEVERGVFRRDLYFRLNVITLRVPPLRQRPDDIPALVAYFLERYGYRHRMSQEVLDLFHTYAWPGNVRQLEHCIQHMVAVNSGPELHLRDLPTALLNHLHQREPGLIAMANAVGTRADTDPDLHLPSVLPLAEVEKRAIVEALRYTRGDRTMAANLLQIGRTTLYRKLKDYGLDVSRVQDHPLQ